jgi:hypothetical protein
MTDITFIGQLIDSMEEAVLRLDAAVTGKDFESANKLRTFIFDLHRQIDAALASQGGGENV